MASNAGNVHGIIINTNGKIPLLSFGNLSFAPLLPVMFSQMPLSIFDVSCSSLILFLEGNTRVMLDICLIVCPRA